MGAQKPRKGGAPSGSQKAWGAQNFALFSSPAENITFVSLSGAFSFKCGLGLRSWTTQIACLGFSAVFCASPGGLQAGLQAAGVSLV